MGAWGTGISSNDTFKDIKGDFIDLYDKGMEALEITKKLISENQEIIGTNEERNNFWFAIALAQWECKSLQPEILQEVEAIIRKGIDIELWEKLGASKQELNKRGLVLDKFLKKLHSERKSVRKRKKKINRSAIFTKGDCLSIQLANGNFGAACVLESEINTSDGLNLVAVCDYNRDSKPEFRYFNKANVLVTKGQDPFSSKFEDSELIGWYLARSFKKTQHLFEIVGNITVFLRYSFWADYRSLLDWASIPEEINNLEERVKAHGKPKKKIKL